MKKEKLEKRLAELMAKKDEFIANANACAGAIAELTSLLKEIIEKDNEVIEDTKWILIYKCILISLIKTITIFVCETNSSRIRQGSMYK